MSCLLLPAPAEQQDAHDDAHGVRVGGEIHKPACRDGPILGTVSGVDVQALDTLQDIPCLDSLERSRQDKRKRSWNHWGKMVYNCNTLEGCHLVSLH